MLIGIAEMMFAGMAEMALLEMVTFAVFKMAAVFQSVSEVAPV